MINGAGIQNKSKYRCAALQTMTVNFFSNTSAKRYLIGIVFA